VKECAGGVGEVANVAWLGALEAVFKVMGDELALGNHFFFQSAIFFFEVADVAWLQAFCLRRRGTSWR